jgi:hypothetical protein
MEDKENGQMIIKKVAKKLIRVAGYEITKLHPPVRPPSNKSLYDQDSLRTVHNHDFMKDLDFIAAYQRGVKADKDHKMHWRVHVALWAASHAKHLEGDFVECGVSKGFLSSAIATYLNWNSLNKQFFLFDTFCGIPEHCLNENERKQGRSEFGKELYSECYGQIKANFAEFKNVHLVRGVVPDTLLAEDIKKVCYLSIDMNCAEPEIAAAEFFWDKMVSGAIALLDDYAYVGFDEQKKAFDKFALNKGVKILSLPTGQGLYIKP